MNLILLAPLVAMILVLLPGVHSLPRFQSNRFGPFLIHGIDYDSNREEKKEMSCKDGEEYNIEYKKCFPPGLCREREELIQRIGYSIGDRARCKDSNALFWIGLAWGWITALLSFVVGTCLMRSREREMYSRIPPRVYIPCEHLMNARFKVRPNAVIKNLHEERKKKLAAEAALANKERALVPYTPPPIVFEEKEVEENRRRFIENGTDGIAECWKDECIHKSRTQRI